MPVDTAYMSEDTVKRRVEKHKKEYNLNTENLTSLLNLFDLVNLAESDFPNFKKEITNLVTEGVYTPTALIDILPMNVFNPNEADYINMLVHGNTKDENDLDITRKIVEDKIEDIRKRNETIKDELIEYQKALFKKMDENPLERAQFGSESGVVRVFQSDTKQIVRKVSDLIVESFSERKPTVRRPGKSEINMRRTTRASMKFGGDPYELIHKHKDESIGRDKPRIYIIVDVSGSCYEFIPISATMAYAFTIALKDYDVVLYSAPSLRDWEREGYMSDEERERQMKNFVKILETAERKDQQGHLGWNALNRFTKKSFKRISDQEILHDDMKVGKNWGTEDYTPCLMYALATIAPKNSVFINITDDQPGISGRFCEYITKKRSNQEKIKAVQNNVFFFDIMETLHDGATKTYVEGLYNDEIGNPHATYRFSYHKDFPQIARKFKVPLDNIYPKRRDPKRPTPRTYADWLDGVIDILKKNLV